MRWTQPNTLMDPAREVSVLAFPDHPDDMANGTADDSDALEEAIAWTCGKGKRLVLPRWHAHYRLTRTIKSPPGWRGLHIRGDTGGDAFMPDDGVEIRCDNGSAGLLIDLDSDQHGRLSLRHLVMTNAGPTTGQAIRLRQIGRNGKYNYPVGWVFHDLSFRQWGGCIQFLRTEASDFFDDAFMGRMELSFIHTAGCVDSVQISGMLLNQFAMRNCRFHVGGAFHVDNGGGEFSLYDCHWEASRSRIHMSNSCYETRFALHSCQGESNGVRQMDPAHPNYNLYEDGFVRHSGSPHFRSFLYVLSGDSLIPGPNEAPPRLSRYDRLINHSQPMAVEVDGGSIETPQTIDVVPPRNAALDAGGSDFYVVPTRAYGGVGTKRTSVAQPVAGSRSDAAPAVGTQRSSWPWVAASNAQYSANQPMPRTPDMVAAEQMAVFSWVAEVPEGGRIANPMVFGRTGHSLAYRYTEAFLHPPGEYCFVARVRADPGVALAPVEIAMSGAGRQSIAYGSWHEARTCPAVELCHPGGRALPYLVEVPAGQTVSITPRAVVGQQFAVRITVRAGPAMAVVVASGTTGGPKYAQLTADVPAGGITFAVQLGAAADFAGIDVANGSPAMVLAWADIEIL